MGRTFIVIPAKDEADRLGAVLEGLQKLGYHDIIVVDDGSRDSTASVAKKAGCIVLCHRINLGSGAATQTGIEFALTHGAEVIVTMDGDGQHDPADVDLLLGALFQSSAEVVIGSRFRQKMGKVPLSRRLFNLVGNVITLLLTGKYTTDSQSGMKAIRASLARKIVFHFHGYEFCTELFHIINQEKAHFIEVPIKAIYTQDSLRKGQNLMSGFRMLFRLLWWKS